MDINRLLALRELARHGTITAAADALHLTPSAISQQLAQLERDFNVGITERRGRGVVLTPAGHALVRHTNRLLAVIDEATSEVAQLRETLAGELRIAAFPSVSIAIISKTVQRLQELHPRLQVIVQEMEPQEGLSALGAWNTDIALIDNMTANPEVKHQAFELMPLIDDVM